MKFDSITLKDLLKLFCFWTVTVVGFAVVFCFIVNVIRSIF